MSNLLNTPEVDVLAQIVEEAARASDRTSRRFVEPMRGRLQRAIARRHHLVFGRRGSGKTTLLRKAVETLTIDRRPIAFVDMESFKGHNYPDVLLSVLIESFREFQRWLETAGRSPANKTTFWMRFFGSKPKRPPFDKNNTQRLLVEINSCLKELEQQLHAADQAPLMTKHETSDQVSAATKKDIRLRSKHVTVALGQGTSEQQAELRTITEESRRSKIDFLHRHIPDYQRLFKDIAQLSGGDAYVFLDDLYHIRRSDQPDVIDYFHRISKNCQLWLKLGTIQHRTEWYLHGDPPIGMKLGDDADEIALDLTLDKYSLTKDFLSRVLSGLATESKVELKDILADGGLERLVLASGGVVRDFLTIFRRSIDIARERGGGHRGDKIGTEDINNAAGEHDSSKREELKRDTLEERERLEQAFDRVRDFCLDRVKTNCFLVKRDQQASEARLIEELVDLRLLHLVRARVTVRGRPGEVFAAYMLDLSQYAGARKHRGLTMIPFWRSDGADALRKISLIFEPSVEFAGIN
jgi:Cdc6-like AAA superfamily ATPase